MARSPSRSSLTPAARAAAPVAARTLAAAVDPAAVLAASPKARAVQARATQAANATIAVLQRLVPIAYRAVGFVRVTAVLSALAAATIMVSFLVVDVPRTPIPWLAGLCLFALLLLPAGVLWLLHGALVEVLELPAWLRSSPELVRQHGGELADLVRVAHGDPVARVANPGRGRRRVVRDLPRLGRLLLEAHRDVPGYGSALRLVNIPFLFASLAAFGATVVLVVLAPLMLFTAGVLRALA